MPDARALQAAGVDTIPGVESRLAAARSVPPPILALAAILEALGPDYPLFYDCGVRSGEDIVKAYALGADFVFIGHTWLFAIAAGGERGLE